MKKRVLASILAGVLTGGELIVGEVSKVNDDAKDNHFSEETHHSIEEDEPVRHLLCGGYVME